jgi:hypothetical protein
MNITKGNNAIRVCHDRYMLDIATKTRNNAFGEALNAT